MHQCISEHTSCTYSQGKEEREVCVDVGETCWDLGYRWQIAGEEESVERTMEDVTEIEEAGIKLHGEETELVTFPSVDQLGEATGREISENVEFLKPVIGVLEDIVDIDDNNLQIDKRNVNLIQNCYGYC